MIKHDEETLSTGSTTYTLYLEFLGGLLPLLKGKRNSKLRPEFVIFDPQTEETKDKDGNTLKQYSWKRYSRMESSESSDNEYEDMCSSPRLTRRKRIGRRSREKSNSKEKELLYYDTLPEIEVLVEVTSNIWGTKFKFHGVAPTLPANLGQANYKTSLLHLQPRQMSLIVTELRDDIPPRPDPNFNPNVFSEDEEEMNENVLRSQPLKVNVPPIAPMTPKRTPSCNSYQEFVTANPSKLQRLPNVQICKYPYLSNKQFKPSNLIQNSTNTIAKRNPSSPYKRSHNLANSTVICSPKKQVPVNLMSYANLVESIHRNNQYNQGNPKQNLSKTEQLLRYIDDESGESEDKSLTPSPRRSRNKKCIYRNKIRSKSVGHLLNVDREERSITPQTRNFHQLSSLEAFLAFSRSLSLKDCKKRQIVAEEKGRSLTEFGKSYSLDSSLLMMNCKSIQMSDDMVNHVSLTDTKAYVNALHSSPNRVHIIKNPSHSTHIYENINIYATSFGTYSKIESPKKVRHKNYSTPYKSHCKNSSQSTKCDNKNWTNLEHLGSPSRHHRKAPKTAENKFIKSLKENVGGERICLTKDYSDMEHSSTPPFSPSPKRKPRFVSSNEQSRSSPPTPSTCRKHKRNHSLSPIRHLLNSPLLSRRRNKNGGRQESSDSEYLSSDADIVSSNYYDLETFQKNQLRNKLRRARCRDITHPVSSHNAKKQNVLGAVPKHRQFYMHNKAPIWNETSQVYQLDFGGRVTQESAKNFQIEYRGKQVMQFGRIDGNAYTLDFQYPFSAAQAFAVALANVTQRLK